MYVLCVHAYNRMRAVCLCVRVWVCASVRVCTQLHIHIHTHSPYPSSPCVSRGCPGAGAGAGRPGRRLQRGRDVHRDDVASEHLGPSSERPGGRQHGPLVPGVHGQCPCVARLRDSHTGKRRREAVGLLSW